VRPRDPDLFDDYPHGPGWRDPDTSRAAAEDIAGIAGTLRRIVFDHIGKHPHQTADDGRGRNPSGHAAHLWIIKREHER
jgi:hypothetical protein